jgi:predicted permease
MHALPLRAQTPIAQLLDPVVAGVYLLCGLALVAATLALTLRRWGWNDAAFGALVAAFPNSGFMGVPLLVALLGEGSAGPVILTMALDMVITTSLCIALSRLGEGEGGAVQALRKALRGMLSNPMPWSIRWGPGIGPGVRAARPGGQDRGHAGGRCLAGGLFTIGRCWRARR